MVAECGEGDAEHLAGRVEGVALAVEPKSAVVRVCVDAGADDRRDVGVLSLLQELETNELDEAITVLGSELDGELDVGPRLGPVAVPHGNARTFAPHLARLGHLAEGPLQHPQLLLQACALRQLDHDRPQASGAAVHLQRLPRLHQRRLCVVEAHLEQDALQEHLPLLPCVLLRIAQNVPRTIRLARKLFEPAIIEQDHGAHLDGHLVEGALEQHAGDGHIAMLELRLGTLHPHLPQERLGAVGDGKDVEFARLLEVAGTVLDLGCLEVDLPLQLLRDAARGLLHRRVHLREVALAVVASLVPRDLLVQAQGREPKRAIARVGLEAPLHELKRQVVLLALLLKTACLLVGGAVPGHVRRQEPEHQPGDHVVTLARLEEAALHDDAPTLLQWLVLHPTQQLPRGARHLHAFVVLEHLHEQSLVVGTVL
mmetsp:Transcript_14955/g.58584  ORF Transcript_14955/g.58584 Transcript_14955/m.58584 type:complete len:427 (+) Transcript_14955:252-1532(+)